MGRSRNRKRPTKHASQPNPTSGSSHITAFNVDRVIALLSLVFGVVLWQIPKSRFTLVACWTGCSLLLVYLFVALTPTVQRRLRVFIAILPIAATIMWGWYWWPTHYFAWLSLNGTAVGADKQSRAVALQFVVRGEGKTPLGSPLPSNALHNVRILVGYPIPRKDAEGWQECYLVQTPTIPIFRNERTNTQHFGWLDLSHESTLLHVSASDDNGYWDSIVVIRIVNGAVESRQLVNGRIVETNERVRLDEWTGGFPVAERELPLVWGRELFRRYGLPELDANTARGSCPTIH